MSEDRSWMYIGRRKRDSFTDEWIEKAKEFIEHVFSVVPNADIDGVRCPCAHCRNCKLQNKTVMQLHLCKYGFKANYEVWTAHGETLASQHQPTPEVDSNAQVDRIDEMMANFTEAYHAMEEEPEPMAQAFYRMLSASEQPLHENTRVTQLNAVTRLMNVKSQHNLSISCFDDFLKVVCDILPNGHKLPPNLYECKKLLSALGMPYEKIDVCKNNCMLYRKEHEKKDKCDICGESRYYEDGDESEGSKKRRVAKKILRYLPMTQRLQRLYMSEESSRHTQWHKNGVRYKPGFMVHPSDGEAWKQFDRDFPDFASEPRNMRIGIATDGFQPFTGAAPYSCWPVFVIPYNLPPGLCMQQHNIFLAMVIPGPEYPGTKLNVFLQPLVDELLELWHNGVVTYDRASRQNFKLRVAYLWSVHDYQAYGIFSGWCVHGKFSCPICMEQLEATWLQNGGKYSWFDCHRQFLPLRHAFRRNRYAFKSNVTITNGPPCQLSGDEINHRLTGLVPLAGPFDGFQGYGEQHNWTHISCLWQLPYFSKLILRHNIDVMHNERNVAEALFNTCFDIPDKTKDNVKARLDQAQMCNRPALNMVQNPTSGRWQKPRADFCLTREQKREILQWFQQLKFPDGYSANLRRGVNLSTMRINGLNSHDYHILIERLMTVMFRGYLPNDIWQVLAELSFFYRQLCAKELDPKVVADLEVNVPILLCKLEKIFPPGFFNPMQHLIVHLPYEARVGGPVQYRWMYPHERGNKSLKKKVKNKCRVEACIAEASLLQEISLFPSLFFADDVHSVHNPTPRYNIGSSSNNCELSIFQFMGDTTSRAKSCELTDREWMAAMLYVLTNLSETEEFLKKFFDEYWKGSGSPNKRQAEKLLQDGAGHGSPNFLTWFNQLCVTEPSIHNDLKQIAKGCLRRIKSYDIYDVNNYRFRTNSHEKSRPNGTTNNSGVLTIGEDDNGELEYYGIIKDIIELTFQGTKSLKLVLFQCDWFHPRSGVRRDDSIGLVEVAHASKLPGYEPFILAHQAKQVYYLPYPCKNVCYLADWWVVYKVQPPGGLPVPSKEDYESEPNCGTSEEFYQEDGLPGTFTIDLGLDLDNMGIVERNADDVFDDNDLRILNQQAESSDGALRDVLHPDLFIHYDNYNEDAPLQDYDSDDYF